MESVDRGNLCRLCVLEMDELVDIFDKNVIDGYTSAELIVDLLQLHVSENDGYPRVLCKRCLAKLNDFMLFKEQCRTAKNIYDNVFAPNKRIPAENYHSDMVELENIKTEPEEADQEDDETFSKEELENTTTAPEDNTEVVLKNEPSDPGKCICSLCGKVFNSKKGLQYHLKIHSGEKPYRCELCSKRFIQRSSLVVHVRQHSREKPFSCEICGKRFSQRTHWINHTWTHNESKPYACDVCGEGYDRKNAMALHVRLHEGEDEKTVQSVSDDGSSPRYRRTPSSPSSAGELTKIRKRKLIKFDQKLDILQKLEDGMRVSELAKTYSLNESTIRTIRKNGYKLNEVSLSLYGGEKTSATRIGKTERLLSMWLEEKQWMDATPSSTVAREKALRIYKRLQEEEEGSSSVGEPFSASKEWYAEFCRRRELQDAGLTGEDGETSVEFQSRVSASPERSTSPLPRNGGPPFKRKVITLGRKLEIIQKLELGMSAAALSRVYEMNESTIRTIRRNAAKIKEIVGFIERRGRKADAES